METMVRETWTDERLDDLTKHMDRGFDRVADRFGRVEGSIRDLRAEMDQRFDKMDARFEKMDVRFEKVGDRFDKVGDRFDGLDGRFERIDVRLDSIQRTMALGAIAMSTAFLAGFGGIAALIATQL